MKKLLKALAIISMVGLSSCGSEQPQESEAKVFSDSSCVNQLNQDQHDRYETFLSGVFMVPGWSKVGPQIVSGAQRSDQSQVSSYVNALQYKMGCAFAVGRIGASELRGWSSQLKNAPASQVLPLVKSVYYSL